MDHKEHINEIAEGAAALYGQNWKALSIHVRDRWIEVVRHMNRGGSGVNEMERLAGQAIDEWYKRREKAQEQASPAPEKKPKKVKSEV